MTTPLSTYARTYQGVINPDTSIVCKSRNAIDVIVTPPPTPNVVRYRLAGVDAKVTATPPNSNNRDTVIYDWRNAVRIGRDPAYRALWCGLPPGGPTLTRYPASGDADTYNVGPADYRADLGYHVVENKDIYASVNVGSLPNVHIRRNIIRGSTLFKVTASVIGNGSNLNGAQIYDNDMFGRNVWCEGVRGSNYHLYRNHMQQFPDFIGLTVALANGGGSVVAEGNYFHNGFYNEWDATTPNMPPHPNYYVHCDGTQFHVGKHYTLRGNFYGGQKAYDPVTKIGYKHHTGHLADIQAADDCFNSGILVKQEVNNAPNNLIEDILIEDNVIMGCEAGMNITAGVDDAFGPANPLSSLTVRNNKWIEMFVDGVGGSIAANQLYMLRGASIDGPGHATIAHSTHTFVDPVTFADTGRLIPVRNG